jgi:hypothetical protein
MVITLMLRTTTPSLFLYIVMSILLITLISCMDEPSDPNEPRQIVECWEQYALRDVGSTMLCDTITVIGDSIISSSGAEGLRNRAAFSHRMEYLLGPDSLGFPIYIRDTTYCLVLRKESTIMFDGDSVAIGVYELEGCRQSQPALLGRLAFARGYGLIANLPRLAGPLVMTRIERGDDVIELRPMIDALLADSTLVAPLADSTSADPTAADTLTTDSAKSSP